MKGLRASAVAALLASLAASFALAQPTQVGNIAGVVKDETGGALPGVTVTVTSEDRGTSRSTVTDAEGKFIFPSLLIGSYSVTASLAGFETVKLTNNLVETDKTTTVPFALKVGGISDVIEVVGESPIVDQTNTAANTRVRREEFDKLPVGRSYQSLIGAVPGVVGTGNVNSLGALTSNNLFLMDSVDTTDPTTGTFGSNLNFEAIQELSVYTSGVSAEYGRAVGAVVNVITKSGTNRYEGSFKMLFVNDDWDEQNSTKNEVTGASLERVKFDKVNKTWNFTAGGPIWRNHAWFFVTYENAKNTSPQRQTVGVIPENFQQTTESGFWNARGTVQLGDRQTFWVKYFESPTDGFVIDYWGGGQIPTLAAQRAALTTQNQTSDNWAANYNAVIRDNWSVEAAWGKYAAILTVGTFEDGVLGVAPHYSIADGKYYNGATFDGYTDRPRNQFNAASNWFLTLGGNSHSLKAGFDFQDVESGAEFKYPNAQFYLDESYNQATNTFVPQQRRDYETGASVSKGKIWALYVRDKFQIGPRISLEAGLRFDKQDGESDIGAITVDTATWSPRISGNYDLSGTGKSLITGSYGRFYEGLLQTFSDAFGGIPQQANYDNYVWDGRQYVFSNRVVIGGSTFKPNEELDPAYMDEFTVGYQQQFGRYMAAGVRFISRTWNDLIDDVRTFNPDGSINRVVVNYDPAERQYRGVQFTFEKRFANNWNAAASYTYSKTEGNHFGNTFTGLGDYIDAQCRTTADTTIGVGGVLPCLEVQNGDSKYGRPTYDRPHNWKFNGAYVWPVGPVTMTFGAWADIISKATYTKFRTVNVLRPGTLTNAGPTATYYYEPLGTDRIDGMDWVANFNWEAAWRFYQTAQAGVRAEVFNLSNEQMKTGVTNTVWCDATSAACETARNNYGTATARGNFRGPRNYRFSFFIRF